MVALYLCLAFRGKETRAIVFLLGGLPGLSVLFMMNFMSLFSIKYFNFTNKVSNYMQENAIQIFKLILTVAYIPILHTAMKLISITNFESLPSCGPNGMNNRKLKEGPFYAPRDCIYSYNDSAVPSTYYGDIFYKNDKTIPFYSEAQPYYRPASVVAIILVMFGLPLVSAIASYKQQDLHYSSKGRYFNSIYVLVLGLIVLFLDNCPSPIASFVAVLLLTTILTIVSFYLKPFHNSKTNSLLGLLSIFNMFSTIVSLIVTQADQSNNSLFLYLQLLFVLYVQQYTYACILIALHNRIVLLP